MKSLVVPLGAEPTIAAWITDLIANGLQVGIADIPTWAHLLILFVTGGALAVINRQTVTPTVKLNQTQSPTAINSAERIEP